MHTRPIRTNSRQHNGFGGRLKRQIQAELDSHATATPPDHGSFCAMPRRPHPA